MPQKRDMKKITLTNVKTELLRTGDKETILHVDRWGKKYSKCRGTKTRKTADSS